MYRRRHIFINRQRAKIVHGFTLIELMVVIAIIGIMLGLGMFAFGDGGLSDKLEDESQRLYGLIKLAQEESIIQSKELALELDRDGYVFKQLYDGQWVAITSDKIFRKRSLTAGIELSLEVENVKLALTRNEDKDEAIRIYILSSGELTPFDITLKITELQQIFKITGQANGQLILEKQDI